jgi:hypothetical protein
MKNKNLVLLLFAIFAVALLTRKNRAAVAGAPAYGGFGAPTYGSGLQPAPTSFTISPIEKTSEPYELMNRPYSSGGPYGGFAPTPSGWMPAGVQVSGKEL